jgi:molybdate transport system permease protein
MRTRASSPLPWLGGLLAIYLLVPIAAFVGRLAAGAKAPSGVAAALSTSLFTATISAAVIAALGIPLAYLLARRRGLAGRLMLALVVLPLALPALMSGVLLLYVVGPFTTLGELFGARLTDTAAGIVLAQTFVAAPFLVVVARAAFVAVDPELEDVAATLGFGPLARFWRVAVAAAAPGIAAGILLAWLRAFSEFGATVILAYHPFSLPVFTFVQFDETGLSATTVPVALALGTALVVLTILSLPMPRRRRRGRPVLDPIVTPTATPIATPGPEAMALDFAVATRAGGFSLQLDHRARSAHLALLGPSGAGKTLTLRALAGLAPLRGDGHVALGQVRLDSLAVQRRGIGYVPQQPALLPRRTVWEQVMFGARATPQQAACWIDRLGLSGLEDRYPHELSGGQRKRVALARALATGPRLLLLDEPFAGLDAPLRGQLARELRHLRNRLALSTVIVTHDPQEAALLADEVIVIDAGRALQAGTREEVFGAPSSPQVAALLGIVNTHRGQMASSGRVAVGAVELGVPAGDLQPGAPVVWCIRPERIVLAPDGPYHAVVHDCLDLGDCYELQVSLGGATELCVRSAARPRVLVGQTVALDLPPAAITVWPA